MVLAAVFSAVTFTPRWGVTLFSSKKSDVLKLSSGFGKLLRNVVRQEDSRKEGGFFIAEQVDPGFVIQ